LLLSKIRNDSIAIHQNIEMRWIRYLKTIKLINFLFEEFSCNSIVGV